MDQEPSSPDAKDVGKEQAPSTGGRGVTRLHGSELLDTLDVGMFMARDLSGFIRYWSAGCERFYGYRSAEAVGQVSHELLRTEFPTSLAEVEAILLSRGEWIGELLHTRRDGAQVVVTAHKVLRQDSTGRMIILEVLADITDVRRLEATLAAREKELRAMNETLEQRVLAEVKARELAQVQAARSDKLAALGQLAGGIAHDFNSLLQSISSAAELIGSHSEGLDVSRIRKLAHLIVESCFRGSAITGRLLGFAQQHPLRRELVEPVGMMSNIRDILSHSLGGGMVVTINYSPDLPMLVVDGSQLETVLVNLATNARDAMNGCGHVFLEASLRSRRELESLPDESEQAIYRASDRFADVFVCLEMTDTGCGMSPDVLRRVTEPFFTTKPTGKGTGLGLAIARSFAEQSGGAFVLRSKVDAGTTAQLWLPAAVATEQARGGPPAGAQAGYPPPSRVLLVDDDILLLDVVGEQLRRAGLNVELASNGRDGLLILGSEKIVDLLISDFMMLEMDGVSLIHQAQRLRPGLPAILLTGFIGGVADIAVEGAKSGRFQILHKPVKGDVLVDCVARALADVR